ncbi:MAG: GNAT family N-acetyltransferase [Actinomycetota bacterium]|nr:GNAT family N-acetyltransferase [Actinomycetota bacterium]
MDRWYDWLSTKPLGWVIEVGGRTMGTAFLHQVDQPNRRAHYAIGLWDLGDLGRGTGTAATRLVLRHAFETLRLHRVDLRVLEYNQRAIACYKKCGFVREGVEREGVLVAGAWHSDVLMSIFEQEYQKLAPGWWSDSR